MNILKWLGTIGLMSALSSTVWASPILQLTDRVNWRVLLALT